MTDQVRPGYPSASESQTVFGELLCILDTAVMLQPETEAVMRACVADGPKGTTLARTGHRLTSTLIDLVRRADRLPLWPVVDDASGLLRYHHRLLDETMQYAYNVTAILDRRAAPYFVDRLGAPATRLRRLRDLIAAYLNTESDTPGTAGLPAQLSHSLRTPLTLIMGNASSLLQPDVDWDVAAHDRFLRGIVTESERLTRVVDNILNLASISSGTLRPDFDWCDVSVVIASALDDVDVALRSPGSVAVTLDVADVAGGAGVVWADHTLLSRAVANVVDNAFRHNPAGTTVTVTATSDGTWLKVVIADTGQGLAAPVVSALAHSVATGVLPTALGTGMATTMGLVTAFGGTVRFLEGAVGTTCVLRLPVAAGATTDPSPDPPPPSA